MRNIAKEQEPEVTISNVRVEIHFEYSDGHTEILPLDMIPNQFNISQTRPVDTVYDNKGKASFIPETTGSILIAGKYKGVGYEEPAN